MTERILTFYQLKDGVPTEDFKAFSRDIDQPACRAKDACLRFDVFTASEGTKNFDRYIIEDVEATSWEAWESATSEPVHQPIMEVWRQLVDEDTLISLRIESI